MLRTIGLDIGGVIIDSFTNDGTDTDFRGDNFMETTPVDGMFVAVSSIVHHFGAGQVVIVSTCGEGIENKTRLWLEGNQFYKRTRFDPDNLYFCRTRAEEAPIAAGLKITDFVDDRADVLEYMKGIVKNRYLFGPQKDTPKSTAGLTVVKDWQEAQKLIMGSSTTNP